MVTAKATRVSAAMAVYNGEKYSARQVDTILCQIRELDGLAISAEPLNDGPKDQNGAWYLDKYDKCLMGLRIQETGMAAHDAMIDGNMNTPDCVLSHIKTNTFPMAGML